MTKAMKITFVATAVLGLAVGAGFGYSEATDLSESSQSVEPSIASSVVSDYAARQFRNADPDHARQAVQLEISIRKRLRAATQDSGEDGHVGFAYVRLAVIEDAAGNEEAGRQAMAEARTWFKPRPGQPPSDDQLKDVLKKLDKAGDRYH